MSLGWGLDALKCFWSLKKGTKTLNFWQNEPFSDILGPLGQYDNPLGKKQKKQNQTVRGNEL